MHPLILVLIASSPAFGQICKTTNIVFKNVTETYRYTHTEPYEDEDCVIFCQKSRLVVDIKSRIVQKSFLEHVDTCCEGYTREDSNETSELENNGTEISCIPICDPPCTNGFCWGPNQCACDFGYTLNLTDRCSPVHNNCKNTKDGIPEEESSTEDTDSDSRKVSRNIDDNNDRNDSGVNATDPDNDFLYYDDISNIKYQYDEGDNFTPICDNPCDNGQCLAPSTCVCNPGWYMNDNQTCLPHCDLCNGNCIAPSVCECFDGFKKVENAPDFGLQCELDIESDQDASFTDIFNAPGLFYPNVTFDEDSDEQNDTFLENMCEYYKLTCQNNYADRKVLNATVNNVLQEPNIARFNDIGTEAHIGIKKSAIPYVWIYAAVGIGLLIISIILIATWRKMRALRRVRRNTLTIEGLKQAEDPKENYRKEI